MAKKSQRALKVGAEFKLAAGNPVTITKVTSRKVTFRYRLSEAEEEMTPAQFRKALAE